MNLIQLGLICLSLLPGLATLLLAYQLMRNGQGAFGKPTIRPFFFYLSKLSIVFIMAILCLASIQSGFFLKFPFLIQLEVPDVQKLLSLVFMLGGNLLLLPGYAALGIFTRVGLPKGEHALETNGVYKISRNPMYTSFWFFGLSCFLIVPSLFMAAIILFNITAHHIIILKEEKYLHNTFNEKYKAYKVQTSRYL